MSDIEQRLDRAHRSAARAGALICYMLIKRRFTAGSTRTAVNLLEEAIEELRPLIGPDGPGG